jgi:hypothetical protein
MHLIEDKAIKIAIKEFQITNPDHQARLVEARTHMILLVGRTTEEFLVR